MAETKVNKQLKLADVRTSYLYCFSPYKDEEGKDGSYCSHLLFPDTHPQFAEIQAAIMSVGEQFWKDKWLTEVLPELKGKDRLCLHRGEVSKPGQAPYKGMLFLSANNKNRPGTFDGNANPITEKEGLLYSGCRVNAIVSIWAQQHPKFGRRINCELNGLQFLRHDERLSGGGRAATGEEFGKVVGADADAAPPGAAAVGGLV